MRRAVEGRAAPGRAGPGREAVAASQRGGGGRAGFPGQVLGLWADGAGGERSRVGMVRPEGGGTPKPRGDGSGAEVAAEVRVSPRRWAVVLLFSSYSLCNAFQWIEYGSVNNVFVRFYGVSAFAIDWLSMSYMLVYIPLLFPVAWLLDKKGLRLIALLGSALNALGAWVKLGSLLPPALCALPAGLPAPLQLQLFHLAATTGLAPRGPAVLQQPHRPAELHQEHHRAPLAPR